MVYLIMHLPDEAIQGRSSAQSLDEEDDDVDEDIKIDDPLAECLVRIRTQTMILEMKWFI